MPKSVIEKASSTYVDGELDGKTFTHSTRFK